MSVKLKIFICIPNKEHSSTITVVVQGEGLGCVMCEFAMQVIDEHMEDTNTIDEVRFPETFEETLMIHRSEFFSCTLLSGGENGSVLVQLSARYP